MKLSIIKKINKKSVWIKLIDTETGANVRYFDSEAGKREVEFRSTTELRDFSKAFQVL